MATFVFTDLVESTARHTRHPVEWKHDAARITVNARTFRAGAGPICHDPDGQPALNSWRPIDRGPARRNIAPFIEQVEYLFADPLERAAFCRDDTKPFGPVQAYVAPATVGVESAIVAPGQYGPPFDADGVDGIVLTTTLVVPAGEVQPLTVIVSE